MKAPTIKLAITPSEANLIGAALGRLPHDDVNALIVKLAQQVQAQMAAQQAQAAKK